MKLPKPSVVAGQVGLPNAFPDHAITRAEFGENPLPEKVTTVPADPVVGEARTAGRMRNVVEAVLPLESLAAKVPRPKVLGGRV